MKNLYISFLLLLGCVVALDSSASQSWSYTYNATGQILTEDGPRTDVSDINTYDTQEYSTSFINALGHAITYNFHVRLCKIFNSN